MVNPSLGTRRACAQTDRPTASRRRDSLVKKTSTTSRRRRVSCGAVAGEIMPLGKKEERRGPPGTVLQNHPTHPLGCSESSHHYALMRVRAVTRWGVRSDLRVVLTLFLLPVHYRMQWS